MARAHIANEDGTPIPPLTFIRGFAYPTEPFSSLATLATRLQELRRGGGLSAKLSRGSSYGGSPPFDGLSFYVTPQGSDMEEWLGTVVISAEQTAELQSAILAARRPHRKAA